MYLSKFCAALRLLLCCFAPIIVIKILTIIYNESKKYRCEWKKDPSLSLWLCESPVTPNKGYCKFCEIDLSPRKDVL